MNVVLISGTPGTGKTTIAKMVGEVLGQPVLHLGDFIRERGLYESWDDELQTRIVDEDTLRDVLVKEIDDTLNVSGKHLVIEGLLSDVVGDVATHAVVLRLHPEHLRVRLESRGYPEGKIRENLQAELLGTCTAHMREARGDDFLDIDTTGKPPEVLAKIITAYIRGTLDTAPYRPGLVDWLVHPEINPALYFD